MPQKQKDQGEKTMTPPEPVSSCCGARMRVAFNSKVAGIDATNWHECEKCGQPCDARQEMEERQALTVARSFNKDQMCHCALEWFGCCLVVETPERLTKSVQLICLLFDVHLLYSYYDEQLTKRRR